MGGSITEMNGYRPMVCEIHTGPRTAWDPVQTFEAEMMKMEATLTAPFDARVVRINVAEGDKVMPGDILVDLEAEEAEDTAES